MKCASSASITHRPIRGDPRRSARRTILRDLVGPRHIGRVVDAVALTVTSPGDRVSAFHRDRGCHRLLDQRRSRLLGRHAARTGPSKRTRVRVDLAVASRSGRGCGLRVDLDGGQPVPSRCLPREYAARLHVVCSSGTTTRGIATPRVNSRSLPCFGRGGKPTDYGSELFGHLRRCAEMWRQDSVSGTRYFSNVCLSVGSRRESPCSAVNTRRPRRWS